VGAEVTGELAKTCLADRDLSFARATPLLLVGVLMLLLLYELVGV
jgi:hypothetical protein